MRLSYILVAAVSTLSVHQVPVSASVGNDVALSGVMSLGFMHFVGADHGIIDQSRYLRGNNIAEGAMDERSFAEVVERVMAKNIFRKMIKKESFSALDKVHNPAILNKISDEADDFLITMFKLADQNNMTPRDLANQLKTFPDADAAIRAKAVELYTNYLNELGKIV
ncbi:RxLR effector protein [Phytophthora megakarya]|uniref:RxLR effector protein n=1 Tax=Phytophthora megakarya TaxID=4795 RepID=A0A225VB85_9STRA|nr:RxLR effector protein [Phytophthora megakarya]